MNARPKLSVETATQLAVFLANRPGAPARVCDALAPAGINIYALATSDTVDHTVVRMVVSDPTKALMLLGEAGVLALETDVLTIETANQPGILAKIAELLAAAGVNTNTPIWPEAAKPKKASSFCDHRTSKKRGANSRSSKDESRSSCRQV
jgi:hypothetical protein